MRLWFGDAVSGPFCVTRTSKLIHCKEGFQSDAIMNGTMSKIKTVIDGKNFWKFKLDYMILMDENHHVVSGAESETMDLFSEEKYIYIELSNVEQNLQMVNEKEIQEFETTYMKDE